MYLLNRVANTVHTEYDNNIFIIFYKVLEICCNVDIVTPFQVYLVFYT